jgi:hypothetical protein
MMTGQAKLAQRRPNMLTIIKSIRTIIALSLGVVALAFSGVASAAIPVHMLGAPVATTAVIAPPTVSAHFLNPLDLHKVGGATSSTGWCESMAGFYNKELEHADTAEGEGDAEAFALITGRAEEDLKTIEDHCLIVD